MLRLPHLMGHNLCVDVFGGSTDLETASPIPGSIGPGESNRRGCVPCFDFVRIVLKECPCWQR